MIRSEAIEENINIYLEKMEKKHNQSKMKIKGLEDKLNLSAKMIQTLFRRYMQKKKERAALKIQRFFKKITAESKRVKRVISNFKLRFYGIKISLALYACMKSIKLKEKPIILKKSNILKKIKLNCCRYISIIAAIRSQIAYVKKYSCYQKVNFVEQWKIYEKKTIDKIWKQIKRKWVHKKGNIWINDKEKQVNAQQYVNKLMDKLYTQSYQKLERSQNRLRDMANNKLNNTLIACNRMYYSSILQ